MAKKKSAARTTRTVRTTRRVTSAQTLPVEKLVWLVLLAIVAVVSAYIALVRFATVRVPAAVVESQVIALTNGQRAANTVGQLTENSLLDKAAQAKANDMAAKGYFSHTGPDGRAPWHWFTEAGYDYHYAGENLAVRFDDSQQVVNAWMASPTHKANIIKSDYTEIGIGIAEGMYQGLPATFVVQFFGTPEDTAAPVTKSQPTPVVNKPTAAVTTSVPTRPTVAGAETVVPSVPQPVASVSIVSRILGFFTTALHSLTASVADSQGVVIGDSASTER